MANYFTNFSFIVPLTSADQQAYALNLQQQMSSVAQGGEVPEGFPPMLADSCEGCFFEADPSGVNQLWLHSDSGDTDSACAYVQHLVQKFNLGPVSFEWSHDCSKPRVDAFGGGAAVITAREIKTFTTSGWLHKQAAARMKAIKISKLR